VRGLLAADVSAAAMAVTGWQANKVIDTVIEYARRLMADGPWKPSAAVAPAARPVVKLGAKQRSEA
jgi:hypothetical protein